MVTKVSGDAIHITAKPRDPEDGYNSYYERLCYLLHRLVCCTTSLTIAWTVTSGNVEGAHLLTPSSKPCS